MAGRDTRRTTGSISTGASALSAAPIRGRLIKPGITGSRLRHSLDALDIPCLPHEYIADCPLGSLVKGDRLTLVEDLAL